MITLENDYLYVNINPLGAELTNLIDKRDGIEHMWEGNPKFWPRKAPILFPCVGESRDRKITVGGVEYPMGRHGFARLQDFTVLESTSTEALFELNDNEETRASYPFAFKFRVKYTLEDAMLIQRFEVINPGNEKMGFQVGGHPAFAVPFRGSESYSDYELRFDAPMDLDRHLLNDVGLYNGEQRNVLTNDDTIPLYYELFNEDALVFKNIPSKQVWIQHKEGGKKLVVDYQEFPHLGIWSVPGGNYVCIEPWIGCADQHDQPSDFYQKDNLVVLEPEQIFEAAFKVSLVH